MTSAMKSVLVLLLAGLGGTAVVASYSREQELEADQLGVETLRRTGYDPFAMATFLETLRRDSQYGGLRAGRRGDRWACLR